MKIFVGGLKTRILMDELQSVIQEINGLATDDFSASVDLEKYRNWIPGYLK
jgi:hypothetical protein